MFVSQQIYKLEMEQKRVQEDALVYNWLQQQLKLSPAYKKVKPNSIPCYWSFMQLSMDYVISVDCVGNFKIL